MARLPRLAVAGEAHLVLHDGHNQQPIVVDDDDRRRLLQFVREAHQRERVAVHAYAILPRRIWLLATPADPAALGRWMQSAGRRYTAAFNSRHGRTGTLWDGRFRSALVEPGASTLQALLFVDQAPVREQLAETATAYRWSSAAHHAGAEHDSLITDVAAYWALGNTPFERQHRYAQHLDELLGEDVVSAITSAARGGWALGSSHFLAAIRSRVARRPAPRKRGRPTSHNDLSPTNR